MFTQLYLTEYLLKVTVLGTGYIMMNTQNPCTCVLYRPLGQAEIQDLTRVHSIKLRLKTQCWERLKAQEKEAVEDEMVR